jgi:hypothetical protein
MSYPQSGPPYGHQPQPHPGYNPGPALPPGAPDNSRKLLNLSGAALIWVIIGVMFVCIGGPIVLCTVCGLGSFLTGVGGVDPSATP